MSAASVVVQPAERHKSFPTLQEGYAWAASLVSAGVGCEVSRLRQSFFKHVLPRDRYFYLLGVAEATARVCQRIEPNGEWRVEIESPGTEYYQAGILSPQRRETKLFRFSAWYSRFLPYAVAMLKAENGFSHRGIDFESINSYYGTCYGFHELGSRDGYIGPPCDPIEDTYHRIDGADCDLYEECHSAAEKVHPADLPFTEVHQACMVYVACFQPWRIEIGWQRELVGQCFESMRRPQPSWRKPR